MVKIRLRRMGNKHRPFYRVVVAKSAAGRNGAFIEILGTHNPLTKPAETRISEERALHWLLEGAQPTETAAYLLKKLGILDKFFEQRPAAAKKYAFLDKTTSAMSKESAATAATAVVEPASAAAEEAPAPAAEEAPAAEISAEEPVADASVEAAEEGKPVTE